MDLDVETDRIQALAAGLAGFLAQYNKEHPEATPATILAALSEMVAYSMSTMDEAHIRAVMVEWSAATLDTAIQYAKQHQRHIGRPFRKH